MRWRNKPLQRQENSQDAVLFLARSEGPKLKPIRIFGSQNLLTNTDDIFPPHNRREHFPPWNAWIIAI
jgi:hypothetical protein